MKSVAKILPLKGMIVSFVFFNRFAIFLCGLFASYINNICNTPDLTVSNLVMGVRGGSAVVSVFCSFNTGLLSVQLTDSLHCMSVCILSFPHILSTLHVSTGFFSLGSLIVADDSKLLLLSIVHSDRHCFECCPC